MEERAAALLFGGLGATVGTREVSDSILKVLEVRSPGLIGAWIKRCAEGEELVEQLLAGSRKVRRGPVGREFAHPAVVEWLLDKSRAAQVDDPAMAGEIASLAVVVAGGLPEGASYRARGLCLLANAKRMRGQWRPAERHLRAARNVLFEATALDRTFYLRCLGLLHWDKREAVEAFALLEQARVRFEQQGALQESGATSAILGTLRPAEGLAAREIDLQGLFGALLRLDWDAQGALGARAALTMAQIVADRGEWDFAQMTLKWITGEQPGRGCGWEIWLEARVRDRLGERDAAIEAYERSREIFSGEGRLYEAGVVGWELAAALARAGRAERVQWVAAETASLCPKASPEVHELVLELLAGPAERRGEALERGRRLLRIVLEGEGHLRAPFPFG